ncbi:MAG: TlyA family RNA methyltransferase [Clostridia bacterium]|nr:TlyA family RNA methyltransferase [Clostridia bacterium]
MKQRLDVYLFENGFAESREKAKAIIMSGNVYINNQKADKAGDNVNDGDEVEVRGKTNPFVSRGGLKLDKAINVFGVALENKVCVDIGASTGGFTDCMLQNGAKKVFCIDVGYGQLAWKLRTDPRVVNMERTNIRYVTGEQIGEKLDFASIDVSFISLKLVLPVAKELTGENGEILCLIKPQFEAGREKVGKKGVVRDINVHLEVVETVVAFAESIGLYPKALDYSPVRGPEGNIEYLLWLGKHEEEKTEINIKEVIDSSHKVL